MAKAIVYIFTHLLIYFIHSNNIYWVLPVNHVMIGEYPKEEDAFIYENK